MRTYKTEGIILRRVNFGEADRLLTILTKQYGKIRVRAPGIRKVTSRKGAHLELFNLSSLFLASGINFDIVTEAQTIDNFSRIRGDLKKIGLAYYICELVDSLCPEREKNREVFELTSQALKELAAGGLNIEDFASQLLGLLGFLAKGKTLRGRELERFIEKILERKLKSKRFLTKLQ